jgi:L-ascorbate metabolism protein UlaG (beta-lactamase superfamily)
MSEPLSQRIHNLAVEPGSLAIFWLGQAGFAYKTPAGRIIYIDPYLSNCVNRLLSGEAYGFKRIMPTPIEAQEVDADLVACTHFHPDHFDYDAVPVLAQNPRIHFAAAPDCRAEFEKLDIPATRYTIFTKGQTLDFGEFRLTGVPADHGDLAPDALGIILQVGGIKVWQVGDTAFRPDLWQEVFRMGIDVIIPPINGAFGNLEGIQAAQLAHLVGAKVAIPCHFWMFAEHGGSPAQFLDACRDYAQEVKPVLLSLGEVYLYGSATA